MVGEVAMGRMRRSKKRNCTVFIILAALILTIGYASFSQPLAYRLSTILPDNSRFGLWGGVINTNDNDNSGLNNGSSNSGSSNNGYVSSSITNQDSINNVIDTNTISNKQWDISFTNAIKVNSSSNVIERSGISYNKLFASFDVLFSKSGDFITYDFTVKNKGEINAKLDSYNVVTTNNDNFRFEVTGLNRGESLDVGKSKTIRIKTTYIGNSPINSNVQGGKIIVVIRYVQK